MSISSIGSSDISSYYSEIIPATGASNDGASGGGGLTAGYLTNIQQATEDQTILAMNPNLAQTISQQASSPLLEPLTAALETLPATGDTITQSGSSLTSLASSMQILQNLSSTGALTSNPSLAQSLLNNYSNPAAFSPGSLVDTSA